MEFECLGTGSDGNCYLLKTDGCTILLDAGIQLNKIVRKVNLNDVDVAFISHKHKDHSKSMDDLGMRGVQIVYGGLNQEWCKNRIKRNFKGNFYTFGVEHGDCLCNACIIENQEDTILYATDFNRCKYNLSMFQFSDIIVECNFIDDKVSQAMIDADPKFKRQINTHMGIEGLLIFLGNLDLSKCRRIILIHQSTDFRIFDEKLAALTIAEFTLKPVGVCQPKGGINWYMEKEEFEIE